MNSLFYNCNSLKELFVNNLDANNVTDTSKMFYNCFSLKSLNFGKNFNNRNEIYVL